VGGGAGDDSPRAARQQSSDHINSPMDNLKRRSRPFLEGVRPNIKGFKIRERKEQHHTTQLTVNKEQGHCQIYGV